MKLKYWIIIMAFGFVFGFLGAWMKVLHKAYADHMLTLAMVVKVVCSLVIAFKLVKHPRLKEFLNR